MKISSLAVLAAVATPVAAEIYFKEQFNDEVRRTGTVIAVERTHDCGLGCPLLSGGEHPSRAFTLF